MRTYVHFGTGNYHPDTAKVYTDLSFFTCDEGLCRDAAKMFNFMTGTARPEKLEQLSAAPIDMRATFVRYLEDEIDHARAGRPANVWAKMNSLVDAKIIDALYRASGAGVKVDLVVRGICCRKTFALKVSLGGFWNTVGYLFSVRDINCLPEKLACLFRRPIGCNATWTGGLR